MLQVAQVTVCSQINTKHGFNPLQMKRRPLYLKIHSVPSCNFSSRL